MALNSVKKQRLRPKVIEALGDNIMFGGNDGSQTTIGRIMGIMGITKNEVQAAKKKEVS